jgi:hypothetical protein
MLTTLKTRTCRRSSNVLASPASSQSCRRPRVPIAAVAVPSSTPAVMDGRVFAWCSAGRISATWTWSRSLSVSPPTPLVPLPQRSLTPAAAASASRCATPWIYRGFCALVFVMSANWLMCQRPAAERYAHVARVHATHTSRDQFRRRRSNLTSHETLYFNGMKLGRFQVRRRKEPSSHMWS